MSNRFEWLLICIWLDVTSVYPAYRRLIVIETNQAVDIAKKLFTVDEYY